MVSECLVISGSYLIAVQNFQIGIVLLVCGMLSGLARYFYEISILQAKEKRINEFLGILRSIFAQFLQVMHDSSPAQNSKDKTLH